MVNVLHLHTAFHSTIAVKCDSKASHSPIHTHTMGAAPPTGLGNLSVLLKDVRTDLEGAGFEPPSPQ